MKFPVAQEGGQGLWRESQGCRRDWQPCQSPVVRRTATAKHNHAGPSQHEQNFRTVVLGSNGRRLEGWVQRSPTAITVLFKTQVAAQEARIM